MSGSNLPPAGANAVAPETPAEPLGLTVHSLPVPGAGAARPSQMGPRIKMLLVLLVCVAPVVASYLTYYVIRPEGRRNFGDLIEPLRLLPDVNAQTLDGKTQGLRGLKGQWLLVSTSPAACDAQCEKHLYLQRQLLTSLGKDRDRFDWVWLVSDDAPVRPALLPALKEATILRLPAATINAWLQAENGHALSDHLYVVDPNGNWMMRFPAKLDVTGAGRAKRDLERLLRASVSWDEPGRERAGAP